MALIGYRDSRQSKICLTDKKMPWSTQYRDASFDAITSYKIRRRAESWIMWNEMLTSDHGLLRLHLSIPPSLSYLYLLSLVNYLGRGSPLRPVPLRQRLAVTSVRCCYTRQVMTDDEQDM